MTDMDRALKRLRTQVKNAHGENNDFAYIPISTAENLIRFLEGEEQRIRCKDCVHYIHGDCRKHEILFEVVELDPDWYCADADRRKEKKEHV